MRWILKVMLAFCYAAITAAYGPVSNVLLYFYVVRMPVYNCVGYPSLLRLIVILAFIPYLLKSLLFSKFLRESFSRIDSFIWWPVYIDDTYGSWLNIAHQVLEGSPISDQDMEGVIRFLSLYSANTYVLIILSMIVFVGFDKIYSGFKTEIDKFSNLRTYPKIVYALVFPIASAILFYFPQLNNESYRIRSITFESSISMISFYFVFFIACAQRRNNELS